MSGYIYEVFDLLGNPLGWWPHDTTDLNDSKMEYTILSRDQFASVNEINEENLQVKLFPNPSNHQHTLSVKTQIGEDLKISMMDLQGRKLRTVFDGKAIDSQTTFDVFLSDLVPALYIYDVQVGDIHKSLRFIKH